MYKNNEIHILGNIENRKKENKHILPNHFNKRLSSLIFFLSPHFPSVLDSPHSVEDPLPVTKELLVEKETNEKISKRLRDRRKLMKWPL